MDGFAGPPFVIDNGSASLKVGFAGDDHPVSVFPAVVGRPRILQGNIGRNCHYDVYIGDEAHAHRDAYRLSCPIVRGQAASWDDVERLWHHAYYRVLRVAPEDSASLHTCTSLTSTATKQKMAEILFETLNIPSLYIERQAILSMLASGRTTGLVVDVGYATTKVVPVFEGRVVTLAAIQFDVGGLQIDEVLTKLLIDRGDLWAMNEYNQPFIKEMKERMCFVSLDKVTTKHVPDNFEDQYVLPDGSVTSLGEATYKCYERFFQPSLVGLQSPSLPEILNTAISKCDVELRETLFGNIILSGGTSMARNFPARLKKELNAISPERNVRFIVEKERKYFPWIGGSILSSMAVFNDCWVSKKQYQEIGPSIIHTKTC